MSRELAAFRAALPLLRRSLAERRRAGATSEEAWPVAVLAASFPRTPTVWRAGR